MTDYTNVDFPYEEIRDEDGNYFCSQQELLDRGYKMSQIWSVLIDDGDGDEEEIDFIITYGPGHHYVNNVGYFATKEHHDGETYYLEEITLDKN